MRAPNIGELLEGQSTNQFVISGAFDFCLGVNDPAANGLTDVCIAQGIAPDQLAAYDIPPGTDASAIQIPVVILGGGNPDLEPETADTFTAGLDYSHRGPVDVNLDVGYFSIEIDGVITDTGNPFPLCAALADPDSPICQAIEREPNGLVRTVSDQPINFARARVEGLDADFDLSTDAPAWLAPEWMGRDARLSLRALATRYLEFGSQATPTTPFVDCSGGFARECSFGVGSTFPDFLVNSTVSLDTSRMGFALRWRYIGPMDNLQPEFDEVAQITRPPLAIPRVGDRHYLDASVQFELGRGLRGQAGIDNLLKTNPPLLGRQVVQSNTDPARYDIFGRRFFLGFQAKLGS